MISNAYKFHLEKKSVDFKVRMSHNLIPYVGVFPLEAGSQNDGIFKCD